MPSRFVGARQTTIAREIELTGVGVHSGAPVSLVLHPAEANTGIRFMVTKRGRIVSEIAAELNQDPFETIRQLLIEENSGVSICGFGMDEKNTKTVFCAWKALCDMVITGFYTVIKCYYKLFFFYATIFGLALFN